MGKDKIISPSDRCGDGNEVPLLSSVSKSMLTLQQQQGEQITLCTNIINSHEEEDDDQQRHDYYRNHENHSVDVIEKDTTKVKLKMTDQELMDQRASSPGQLRLTAEGLKVHDKVRDHAEFQQLSPTQHRRNDPLRDPNSSTISCMPGYNVWKQRRDRKQWLEEKWEKQDQRIEQKMKYQCNQTVPPSSCSEYSTNRDGKEKKVDEVSVAPMAILTDEKETSEVFESSPLLTDTADTTANSLYIKRTSLWRRRRTSPTTTIHGVTRLEQNREKKCDGRPTSSPTSINVESWLKREREKQIRAEEEKRQLEAQEHERIQRNKEIYLQKQRALEVSKRPPEITNIITTTSTSTTEDISSTTSSNDCKLKTDHVNDFKESGHVTVHDRLRNDDEKGRVAPNINSSNIKAGLFTLTTKPSNQPCALCGVGERTHIAMPCMHYTFCENCVHALQSRKIKNCPCCNRGGTSFIRVF